MKLKQVWNYFLKSYSYFHRHENCFGYTEIYNLEATNICPMECKMCPRKHMTRKLGHMDLALYRKIIDQTKKFTDILWLDHFGDPLYNPFLKDMIGYAKRVGIETRISTNPTSLSKKKVTDLLEMDIDRILISLDGTNQTTYELLRGRNANYELAVNNINQLVATKLKLKQEKPFIELSMIRMKENDKEIAAFQRRWNIPGINKILIKQFKTWDGSDKDIITMASEAQLSPTYKTPHHHPCLRPWFIISILWDGRVVPCCYDYDGKYVIGDLKSESLRNIWNNENMKRLRRQHINNDFRDNPLCATCREKIGYPPSKLYPFDPRLFTKLNLKKIFNSIKREEESVN